MLNHQKIELKKIGVQMRAPNCNIHFGFGKMTEIRFEYGASLMEGRFDVNAIGAYTYLGGGETIVRNTESIGRFCSIAPNLVTGVKERPTDFLSTHRFFQGMFVDHLPEAREFLKRNATALKASRDLYEEKFGDEGTKITIGNDVWIGEGAFIRRGVKIGDGAIIAGRSVVVRDVQPYEIVGGIPAKPIRKRFDQKLIDQLLELRWWDYGLPALEGADFVDPEKACNQISRNIKNNNLLPWEPASKTVLVDGTVIDS